MKNFKLFSALLMFCVPFCYDAEGCRSHSYSPSYALENLKDKTFKEGKLTNESIKEFESEINKSIKEMKAAMKLEGGRDRYIGLKIAHAFDLISLVEELNKYQTLIGSNVNEAKETKKHLIALANTSGSISGFVCEMLNIIENKNHSNKLVSAN